MNAADIEGWIKVVGAGALGIGATLLALRRRISSDSVQRAEDSAKVGMLEKAIQERDQLAAEVQRVRDAYIEALRKNERLESDALHDLETIERLQRDYQRLLPFAPEEVRRVLETTFGQLGPPEL